MFCPSCGVQDPNPSQFCRTCGTDLNTVRGLLDRADTSTMLRTTARDRIGQAIADKISELQSASDLKEVAEDILPRIQEFLESPEERRLRSLREGTITTAVGLGVLFGFLLIKSVIHSDTGATWTAVGAGSGIIVVMIGLGILASALWSGVLPRKFPEEKLSTQTLIDEATAPSVIEGSPSSNTPPVPFVTESTTRQLR